MKDTKMSRSAISLFYQKIIMAQYDTLENTDCNLGSGELGWSYKNNLYDGERLDPSLFFETRQVLERPPR